MNASLGFDILAMVLSTIAAVIHGVVVYNCRRIKDKDQDAKCTAKRRPAGKIMITLSLVCVATATVMNALLPGPVADAHTQHVIKSIHVWAILLPVTVTEFFIIDNL